MLTTATRWKRRSPLLLVAAVYALYFHAGELGRFCLVPSRRAVEMTLAVPPLALSSGEGWAGLLPALLACGVYSYALLSVSGGHPVLLAVLLPLLFGVTAFASYYVTTTGVPITTEMMEAVFETNSSEAAGVFQWGMVFAVMAGLCVCAGLWLLVRQDLRVQRGAARRRWAAAGLRGLAGAGVTAYALSVPVGGPLALYPHNLMRGTVAYVRAKMDLEQRMARRRDIGAAGASWTKKAADDLVVVVVLGEAARPDHFSINGYGRPTTPVLSATENLVSFTEVRSCATMTRESIPCLMTRATEATPAVALDETSFISIFNRLGFTTAWLSANGVYGEHDSAVSAIAREAAVREFRCAEAQAAGAVLDGDLVPWLGRFLDGHAGRRLAVLHTEGSHWPYDARYPAGFGRFAPAFDHRAFVSWDHEQLVNAYDNSVLYTDTVLGQVIAQLRERNALLLYVADHGEMLGEDGRYMHGQECPEVRHVPMLWWASETFLRDHGGEFARLGQRRQEPVSHDFVFHSLLDCVGVASPLLDPRLSLCRVPSGAAAGVSGLQARGETRAPGHERGAR